MQANETDRKAPIYDLMVSLKYTICARKESKINQLKPFALCPYDARVIVLIWLVLHRSMEFLELLMN